VAVLGGGPAAWDNAAVALEAGAAGVDIYIRRAKLPQINKGRGSAGPAFFEGWPALPPGQRWQLLAYMHDQQSPPPHESIHRVLAHANARVHLGAPLLAATRDGAGVRLTLGPDGRAARVDFLIVATGFAVDLARQPELAAFAPHIATWADAFTPPPGLERPELGRFPFLGPGFELTERRAGACPALGRVHLFNHAATASMGAIASDIPGVSTAAERLARHIVQSLFREDFASVMAGLEAFAEPELESTPFFDPAAFPKKVM
jgi:cation diffusion facilitator CzcD-associated flavoprotein CzcO